MSAAEPPASGGPIGVRTALILVLAGVFSFAAMMVLGAYQPDRRGQQDDGAHALSPSAVGYAGMVQLLHELGRPAVVARGPVNLRTPSVMVLTIDHGDPQTPLRGLPTTKGDPWPILAVLPKWNAVPVLLHASWAQKLGLRPLTGPLNAIDADVWVGLGDGTLKLSRIGGTAPHRLTWLRGGTQMTTGPIEQFQVFTASAGWRPIIVDADSGGVVLAQAANSNFFALADPDLLNTQGIKDPHTAAVGVAVLASLARRADTPVFFDVTLNGFGRTRSMIKLLVEPPFLAATLSVLAAALLLGWAAFNRFGPARRQGRVFAFGKQALADNQAALIRMTGREHRLGGRYVQGVRERVARAVAAPRGLDEAALDEFLDRLGRHRGTVDSFTELANQAAKAKTAGDMQRVAERLYRWRRTVTGETVVL